LSLITTICYVLNVATVFYMARVSSNPWTPFFFDIFLFIAGSYAF